MQLDEFFKVKVKLALIQLSKICIQSKRLSNYYPKQEIIK